MEPMQTLYTGPDRRRRLPRLDLDVRGLIGLMSVTGLFGIVFTQLTKGIAVAIPPEVAGTVGAAIGFYFGGKGAAGTEMQAQQIQQGAEQGVRLEQVHELVNSRLDAVTQRLEDALATVAIQREELGKAAEKEPSR